HRGGARPGLVRLHAAVRRPPGRPRRGQRLPVLQLPVPAQGPPQERPHHRRARRARRPGPGRRPVRQGADDGPAGLQPLPPDPDSRFEPVSWDEALDLVARKLLALRDADEARAVASKTSGRLPRGTGALVSRLFALLGSPNDTDVGPVCNDAGGNALAWTFGL